MLGAAESSQGDREGGAAAIFRKIWPASRRRSRRLLQQNRPTTDIRDTLDHLVGGRESGF